MLLASLVGRAARVGLELRPSEGGPLDEEALGDLLLDQVIAASARGLDAERALRGAIRRLTDRIRIAEAQADAGERPVTP